MAGYINENTNSSPEEDSHGGTGKLANQENIAKIISESLESYVKSVSKTNELKKKTDELKKQVETFKNDDLKSINKDLNDIKKDIKALKGVEFRSIEIIGIISSIIALVLVFVNISTDLSTLSLKDAYLILVTVAATLILFASLLHSFFSSKENSWIKNVFSIILPIVIILFIGLIVLFQ